ncbi:MAG: hypothetical protein QOI60_844 [Actinomycetota bacterium]|jgi:hypothetical protein|nr:hypothetical protein [Actinomycetota bacterium]MEA2579381.1 hypothetical protein [Actinomycetota bacterium]
MVAVDQLAAAERRAWAEFMALISRVPAERRDERDVVPGWSVKDLVWHNVGWATFAARELQKLKGLPYTDPFAAHDDAHWDRESDAILEAGRRMSWDEMLVNVEAEREQAHELLADLGELGPEAAAFFAEESSVHYREHSDEIERFLEG